MTDDWVYCLLSCMAPVLLLDIETADLGRVDVAGLTVTGEIQRKYSYHEPYHRGCIVRSWLFSWDRSMTCLTFAALLSVLAAVRLYR